MRAGGRNLTRGRKDARALRRREARHLRLMSEQFKRRKTGKDLDSLFNGDDRNGGKPGGGPKNAGASSAGAAAASSERRFKPPSQYAAERVRSEFDEVHDLTPLISTNVQCCIGIDIAPPSKNHFDLARFV